MDTTTVVDDIEIKFSEPKQVDREILTEGAYMAKLVLFKVAEKPDWKIANEQKKYPKKTIDPQQWEWQFQLTDEGYEDVIITDWTSCTFGTIDSPHKATARTYAALLLGKSDLLGNEGMSTQQLIGRPIELWLTEGNTRNFIDAERSRPVAPVATKTRPPRTQAPPVQLKGFPPPEGDSEFWDISPETLQDA